MGNLFHIGASGLSTYQEKIDVTANNMANIDTGAYKPQETSFSDLMYTQMDANASSKLLTGNGVKLAVNGIDSSQGGMEPSQGKYDLAINGNGWFSVSTPNGNLYTRDGSFTVSVSGDTAYLVNSSGDYVLNSKGEKISTTIESGSAIDVASLTDNVGVFDFANPEALTPMSKNCYGANSLTGTATAVGDSKSKIQSGYLEQSGVSMSDEMVNLISAQRAYQLSARVVQSADEIASTVNGLRA